MSTMCTTPTSTTTTSNQIPEILFLGTKDLQLDVAFLECRPRNQSSDHQRPTATKTASTSTSTDAVPPKKRKHHHHQHYHRLHQQQEHLDPGYVPTVFKKNAETQTEPPVAPRNNVCRGCEEGFGPAYSYHILKCCGRIYCQSCMDKVYATKRCTPCAKRINVTHFHRIFLGQSYDSD